MNRKLPPLSPPPMPPYYDYEKVNSITIGVLVLVLISVVGFGAYKSYEYGDECKNLIEYTDRANLYDNDNRPANYGKVSGVYFVGENYYCVYTKDRSPYWINLTDMHEGCHDFAYKDPAHFCNSSCEKIGYSSTK